MGSLSLVSLEKPEASVVGLMAGGNRTSNQDYSLIAMPDGRIHFRTRYSHAFTVSLHSQLGREMFAIPAVATQGSAFIQLPVSSLSNGRYLVRLRQGSESRSTFIQIGNR
jgi:hypothetical protein